jgi:hypothetical protein
VAETVLTEAAPPALRDAELEISARPRTGGQQDRATATDPSGQPPRELRLDPVLVARTAWVCPDFG